VPIYGLTPGLSQVLPWAGAPSSLPAVASLQADGTMRFDFGRIPRAKVCIFGDVARIVGLSSTVATIDLAVSGPAGSVVERVGFWADGHMTGGRLSLSLSQTQQLGFVLSSSRRYVTGSLQGTLTITAQLGDGRVQQARVPLVVDVESAH
jgi:hypothetical protein